MSLKILNIHKWDSGSGGAGRYYLNHEKIMSSQGHLIIPWSAEYSGNRGNSISQSYFAPPSPDFQELSKTGAINKISIASSVVWNTGAARKLNSAINHFKPDIIHAHNIYHQLSASVLEAATNSGIPVVQSLHDFSHFCIQSHFFRNGSPCYDCIESGVLQGVRHRCFNNSLPGSLLTTFSRYISTQKSILKKIAGFTTPNNEIKNLLVELGLPCERILVIDNPFITKDFPFEKARSNSVGNRYIAAWGTFAEMKGFGTLLDALELMSNKITLKIYAKDVHAASNFLRDKVVKLEAKGILKIVDNLRYGEELFGELARASLLVVPSEWLVTQEYTVWEGMLLGRPVIVGNRGGNQLLVDNHELVFKAGNSADLAATLDRVLAYSHEHLDELGIALRNRALALSDTKLYASKIENFYNEIR
ncbi:MAG: glycosyltransferase [Hydrogenophaga sp.]|uniref:glycosyltransferase n=1 Tax=Hydrogenophaga sp. TaxID=1904254 RepID=UPI002728A99F|nr:glycosyltransferase [Hydrogenophaga sp.]MDO9570886.1 glycosyltransferase [Hydrogenophaga sp.]MDP3374055.1 glycosyltransferase [Hydrogenophaga sp.]